MGACVWKGRRGKEVGRGDEYRNAAVLSGTDGERALTPRVPVPLAMRNWQSRTDWHRIVSCRKEAEFTRTLTKGSYVMVEGAMRTRAYERAGAKHPIGEVRADTIGKLDRAERRTEAKANLTRAIPE